MIPVTKPFLPPQGDYAKLIAGIWERNILTNSGPLAKELESKLALHLHLKQDHFLFLSNGTIAIQIAIKALGLTGEIITTPFSYVATTSSVVWEGCTPVFVDIDEGSLNIDPTKIESKITANTTAILATHVYGNPCNIDAIQTIANKHKLKVIYDAAHCFGSLYKGKSVYAYGDFSTASFHATKLFHTVEGGAIYSDDSNLIQIASKMRNFGHAGPYSFSHLGINGKNSEVHAAMGLVNLRYVDEILAMRKKLSLYYDQALAHIDVRKIQLNPDGQFNYSYYPVIFPTESALLNAMEKLTKNNILPRRYFYPDLSQLPYVQSTDLPIAKQVSRCVLCLPLYHTLSLSEIDFIANTLKN